MRIEALTPLRFIAAAIVVIFHFGQDAIGIKGTLVAGPQMVSFFFVLSGFVLAVAYIDKPLNVGDYYTGRAARVLPVYFLALFMSWVVFATMGLAPDLLGLALSMLLVQAWVPSHALALNAPGWSLSVEAFFYLIFPLLVMLIVRFKLRWWSVFAVALALWALTQWVLSRALGAPDYQHGISLTSHFVHYFPLSHLCSFVLGVAGGYWYCRNTPQIANALVSTVLIVAAAGLLTFVLENQRMILHMLGFKPAYRASFLSPLYLLLIIAVAVGRGPLVQLLNTRPLVFLGEISYSVYILHYPVFFMYRSILAQRIELSTLSYFVCYFALLLLLSALCFRYFEKPANRYFRYTLPQALAAARLAKKQ